MTFNRNAKIDSGKVSRRGRTTGIAVGGGGLLVVGLIIVSQLIGVDLTGFAGLAGGGTGQQQSQPETALDCDTGADANASTDCLMVGAASSLDAYWSTEAAAEGIAYRSPADFVLFDAATTTGCGQASSATGPFYCPPDETIYVDTSFFDELRTRFGASGGSLSQLYVVAHEWGHHIQNLTGVLGSRGGGTGPDSDSVRTELQADCYAGAWVGAASTTVDENGVTFLEPVTAEQIADALNAASVIGDDRIQQQSGGSVDPDSWTHGSSESRQRWFETGLEGGPGSCDTFAVDGSQL